LNEALPWASNAVTAAATYMLGRRGRRASAAKDEADALDKLAGTVAELGGQVQGLYVRLSQAEKRAADAEAELGRLRMELNQAQENMATAEVQILELQRDLSAAQLALAEAQQEVARLQARLGGQNGGAIS